MTCSPSQQSAENAPERRRILTPADGELRPQAAGQTEDLVQALQFIIAATAVPQVKRFLLDDNAVNDHRVRPTVGDWERKELLDHRVHLEFLLETGNRCLLSMYLLVWLDPEGDPASLG